MPAKAGIQNRLKILDSRLRGNDAKGCFKTFYETIIFIAEIEQNILNINATLWLCKERLR
jgi:hypothetical protein